MAASANIVKRMIQQRKNISGFYHIIETELIMHLLAAMSISRVFSSNDLSRKTRLIKSKYSACVPAVNAFLSLSLFSLAPAVAPSLLQMHPLVAKKKKTMIKISRHEQRYKCHGFSLFTQE